MVVGLMALPTEQDKQIFYRHIAAFPPNTCPICFTHQWTFVAIVEALAEIPGIPTGTALVQRPAVPLAIVMCTQCFYIVQFAWLPIKARMGAMHG
jgi:hypothetical protein